MTPPPPPPTNFVAIFCLYMYYLRKICFHKYGPFFRNQSIICQHPKQHPEYDPEYARIMGLSFSLKQKIRRIPSSRKWLTDILNIFHIS